MRQNIPTDLRKGYVTEKPVQEIAFVRFRGNDNKSCGAAVLLCTTQACPSLSSENLSHADEICAFLTAWQLRSRFTVQPLSLVAGSEPTNSGVLGTLDSGHGHKRNKCHFSMPLLYHSCNNNIEPVVVVFCTQSAVVPPSLACPLILLQIYLFQLVHPSVGPSRYRRAPIRSVASLRQADRHPFLLGFCSADSCV